MEGEGYLYGGGFCGMGKDHFFVEELLNFSDEGISDGDDGGSEEAEGNCSTDSCPNSFSAGGSLASRFSGDLFCRSLADAEISGDFCVPKEELAELEWLSNFVEESFSGEEAHKAAEATGGLSKHPFLAVETPAVPGKARSKRARGALRTWSSRLPHFFPRLEKTVTSASKACFHCGAGRTPQWRAGPMGQKTLCNACGVRFKSGRLVPEYRPAASPTFVLSMHSNSHRKVMEIRRQKEILLQQEEDRLRRCS